MKLGRTQGAILGLAAATLSACATAGSTWFEQGNTADDDTVETPRPNEKRAVEQSAPPDPARFETRVLGSEQEEEPVLSSTAPNPHEPVVGRVLGTFRNTYYDFPLESDFDGNPVTLHDVRCGSITDVPRGFYEAVCVQGSGILTTGQTISFAKRGCDCAEVCPKTGEKICFEALDATKFPWGRGALGLPITPLLTVAVDDSLVPMGTPIYIPEFDGLPVDRARSSFHDGCFIAQDRGLRVKGEHVDVFTGTAATTQLWNQLVPTNHGVTVVLDSPRCARAEP